MSMATLRTRLPASREFFLSPRAPFENHEGYAAQGPVYGPFCSGPAIVRASVPPVTKRAGPSKIDEISLSPRRLRAALVLPRCHTVPDPFAVRTFGGGGTFRDNPQIISYKSRPWLFEQGTHHVRMTSHLAPAQYSRSSDRANYCQRRFTRQRGAVLGETGRTTLT